MFEGSFVISCETEETNGSKIAAFDLDHTLIRPIKGKWPDHSNPSDYVVLPKTKEKLQKLVKEGYKIVIFTNQSSSKFDKNVFTKKVENIEESRE